MKTRILLFALMNVLSFGGVFAQPMLNGPTRVCPGELETYTISGANVTNCTVFWEFTGASDADNNQGSVSGTGLTSIDIQFGESSADYIVTAFVQKDTPNSNCTQDINFGSLNVGTVSLSNMVLTGNTEVDAGVKTRTYTANVSHMNLECSDLTFNWNLSNASNWTVLSGGDTDDESVTFQTDKGSGAAISVEVICEDCENGTQVLSDNIGITRRPPPVQCNAKFQEACIDEENGLSVDIPKEFSTDVTSVLWNLSGANCSPCSGAEINAIANAGGTVQATVMVNYNFGLTSVCNLEYFVGEPEQPVITYLGFPDCLPSNHSTFFFADADGATSYFWAFPSCAGSPGTGSTNPFNPDPNCWYAYDANPTVSSQMAVHTGIQNGPVSVWTTNRCGTTSRNLEIKLCDIDDASTTGNNGPGGGPKIVKGKGPIIPYIGQNPNDISIYPNPFSATLSINGNESEGSKADFTCNIYNSVGQMVYSKIFETEQSWNTNVEAADFETGIYFLEIVQDHQVIFSNKIVKQ